MRGYEFNPVVEPLNFSTVDIIECKKHLNIEETFEEDDYLLEICLHAAKEYVFNYTSLSVEELDKRPSVVLAVLVLVSDFYSRRSAAFGYDDNKVNFMLKAILDQHKRWL